MARDLSSVSDDEFRKFLDSFDHIFCDINGVLWFNGTRPFEGIKETFQMLVNMGKKVHFVTHDNFRKDQEFCRKLREIVPNLTVDDIVTPSAAIIDYLKEINFEKKIWYIGSTACRQKFGNAGFKLEEPLNWIDESMESMLHHATDNTDVGAVIFDLDLNCNYVKLLKAITYLKREDVHFLSGATEYTVQVCEKTLLGSEGFRKIVEYVTGRSPISFGKPSIRFGDFLIKKFGIKDTSRSLFVGDTLVQDIMFGNRIGFKTLLVLSGATKQSDIQQLSNTDLTPTYMLYKLSDLNKQLCLISE